MSALVRLSIRLPFSPRIDGALLPTGSGSPREEKDEADLPRVGHRITLGGARQHHAGSRAGLFPTPFHLSRQRRGFAADRL